MDNYNDILRQIGDHICGVCDSQPRIVWLGGLTGEKQYGMRCNCWQHPKYPVAPSLVKPTGYATDRLRRMTELANDKTESKLGIEELF